MKKYLLAVKAVFSLLLLSSGLAVAQPTTPNLLINGDFEDRNHAPRGQSNIGPVDASHPYDDLKNWYHPGAAPYYALNSSDDSPDYMASDATDPYVNTNTILSSYGYGGFSSHSGISCVRLIRHNQDRDIRYDEFVTQQLGQALLPGHLYHAEFWVLRLPGGPFHNKLSLNITDADPIFDANANQNKLIPSPGNKVIESADIQQRLVWTKVSGDIVIPGSERNNRWVTIGFTREGPGLDNTLPDDYPLSGIGYAIDDVSLVDMGCATPAIVADMTYFNSCKLTAEYIITNYDPNLTYSITVSNSLGGLTSLNGSRVFCKGRYNRPIGSFTLTATSNCGASTSEDYTLEWGTCDEGEVPVPTARTSKSATMAYPNPVAESLTLPEGAEQGLITNSQGKVVQQASKTGQIDVRQLPEGLYNLQMVQDGKLINQRIQVKH